MVWVCELLCFDIDSILGFDFVCVVFFCILSNLGCICFKVFIGKFNYVVVLYLNGREMEIVVRYFLKYVFYEWYSFGKNSDSFDGESGSIENC